MIRQWLYLFCFILAGVSSASAQDSATVSNERSETSLISNVKSVYAGQKFWMALHIKLAPGWHTYWKNPGDSGIAPLLDWKLPKGITAGDVEYLPPMREIVGPLVDYAYTGDGFYPVPITVGQVTGTNAKIVLKARWLVCKEVCIPETTDLALTLPVSATASVEPSDEAGIIAEALARRPQALAEPVGYQVVGKEVLFDFTSPLTSPVKNAVFFPEDDGFISNADEQKTTTKGNQITFHLRVAENSTLHASKGLVSLFTKDGQRKDYDVRLQLLATPPAITPPEKHTLLTLTLFALLGGLILNFMPCVFPILSLKALAIAKKSALHPTEIRLQGIAYALGVIISFLVLAFILVVIEKTGQAVGWGYQMQSPPFVAALALILFAVGLNLSGAFELPVLFGNWGNSLTNKESLLGSFVTGVLAVMVATPCTAPFMAPAIGFALTSDTKTIILIFSAIGVGLSLPFLLISLFPKMVTLLPKPGAWMNTFKKVLALPMYATVLWLVWILRQEAGTNGLLELGFAMIAVLMLVWIGGKNIFIKYVALIVIVGLVGFAIKPSVQTSAPMFSQAALDELRQKGSGVFVDATADWCITCKVNESLVLSSPAIKKLFAEKQITYMVADWTHGDMDITRYLESFGRRGVPLYVYYPPSGAPKVLPQILSESTLREAIK